MLEIKGDKMLREKKYEQLEKNVRHNFRHHEALVVGENQGGPTQVIWRKPGTGEWAMNFYITESILFVSGDIGYSTYKWHGGRLSIQWLGGLGVGYFLEKRVARDSWPQEFDADVAYEEGMNYIDEYFGDFSPEEDEEAKTDYYFRRDMFEDRGRVEDQHDWRQFYKEYNYKIFGDDEGQLYNAGDVLSARDIAPMIALEMIAKQLREI